MMLYVYIQIFIYVYLYIYFTHLHLYTLLVIKQNPDLSVFRATLVLFNQGVCTKHQLLWKPEKIGTQINVLPNCMILKTDIHSDKPDV